MHLLLKNLMFITVLIYLFSCNKQSEYIERINKNDIQKIKPVNGDWLIEHKEKYISFREYKNKYKPIELKTTDTILLYLINDNPEKNKIIYAKCEEYLRIFFQREVFLTNTIELRPNSNNSRIGYDENLQLNAKYIIDSILSKPSFKNYLATMALTTEDIYPGNEWNYVFGLAYYNKRVGITSINRFDSEISNLKLLRLLKTATHEISHMFGISHCITNECLMNGSNHIKELDRNQLRLCSLCQEKIIYRLNLEPEKRLIEMLSFLSRNNLTDEYEYINLDSNN